MLAHSKFIHNHALIIQSDREERKRLWRFDKKSYFYLPKKDRHINGQSAGTKSLTQ
jgi:hypothetical protein